jgi:hypothetical protein
MSKTGKKWVGDFLNPFLLKQEICQGFMMAIFMLVGFL